MEICSKWKGILLKNAHYTSKMNIFSEKSYATHRSDPHLIETANKMRHMWFYVGKFVDIDNKKMWM